MISAWRLVPARREEWAFDGEGGRLYGGRWNSPGRSVIYLAGSRALAALEVLVHMSRVDGIPPYSRFEVILDPDLIETCDSERYRSFLGIGEIHRETQKAGDRWLAEARAPALRIWSSMIPEEPNYLLNPNHPAFGSIEIGEPEPFLFDRRFQAK